MELIKIIQLLVKKKNGSKGIRGSNAKTYFIEILVVDCGDPGDPYGGYRHIATDTKYESTVTYTCKPDHHLEGEDSQVCQGDGLWSGSKPVCLGMYAVMEQLSYSLHLKV